MLDWPTWVWQVAAAIGGGLGLGVGLGALMQRRGKRSRSPSAASTAPAPPQPARAATGQGPTALPEEADLPRPARGPDTPQQRLLERQREQSAQLASQLRSAAETHARELGAKTQEHQAERLRAQRELEALRQAHAEELAHLMSVLVEQVDKIHQAHGRHVRLLEAEVAAARAGRPSQLPPGPLDTGPTSAMVAEAARAPRRVQPEEPPLSAVDNPPLRAAEPPTSLAPTRLA
jgi:hypothetical protein